MNARRAAPYAAAAVAVIVLPLLGVWCAGGRWADYLEFPPLTRRVTPAPFAPSAFALLAVLTVAVLFPFARRMLTFREEGPATPQRLRRLPWWGGAGLALGVVSWVLAWTRFEWFALLQRHTFTPLWVAYILVMNALAFRRTGRCPLTDAPAAYLALFPVSAVFWWLFEYLNRFTQNWWYLGAEGLSGAAYAICASLSFSTVLPAVTATAAWVGSCPRLMRPFRAWRPVRWRPAAGPATALAGLGLLALPFRPDLLFPLLWLAPLAVLIGLPALAGRATVLAPLRRGDWRPVVRYALAALVCGLFWEMWNFRSEAKWIYEISYVGRFRLFEMPSLGYAGYLPFGLECAAAAAWVRLRFVHDTTAKPATGPAAGGPS